MFALENIKRRQQTVKKYFNKSAKAVRFKVNEKVLLWDSAHADKGRLSKFQKLWLVILKSFLSWAQILIF
jgi:hypothetical protein